MNLSNILLIISFLVLLFGISDNREQPGVLDLEEVKQIRVSLYGLHPIESLRFSADSATVRMFSGDLEIRFDQINIDLSVSNQNNRLYLETANEHLQIDSLSIDSHTTSTQVITDPYGYRFYRGSLMMKQDFSRESIQIINSVDLEDYIASVVGSEMNFLEPEALKAQAVVSRTYALWSVKQSPYPDFDVRDHEANQMYVGEIRDRPHYDLAADSTTGEILTWSDQLILAVFSSTCGGETSNNEDVWNGKPHPYLRTQHDHAMCSTSPHYQWNHTVDRIKLQEIIRRDYGFRYVEKHLEKDHSGRVHTITFKDRQGDELNFTGNEFRLYMNQTFGLMAVRSTWFSWNESNEHILIEGKGLGHGVGMCQWGAKGFAENGWSYKDILSFYFSGTKVVNLEDIESKQMTLYQ